MAQLQQKQKYLRENISIDQYEDFADFFQNQAGQIDISQLSIQYLIQVFFYYIGQIVNKYKSLKAKQEEQQQHQRSFANYQTADLHNAYTIVGGLKSNIGINQNNNNMGNAYTSNNHSNTNNNTHSNNNNNNNYLNISSPTSNQNPIPTTLIAQKSATDLLDSVFQQSSSSSSLSSSPPSNITPNYNSNSPPNNQKNFRSSTNNMSFFQNNNIWATTSNIQNNSQRKSVQFDNFWQLPGSTNGNMGQFKTEIGYQNNSGNLNKDKQKVPSFEELTKNLNLNNTNNNTINMQKKSNPYIVDNQKPSNMKKQQQINKYSSNPSQTNKKAQKDKKQQSNTNINNYTSNKPIQSSSSLSSSNQIKLISTKPITSKPGSVASSYKMNKIPYQGPVIHKIAFSDTIKCYQAMPRPQLNDKLLSVTIQKHEIVQRNFFVSDYVMYFLTIKPLGIVCKRNYQDFTKLRAALQKVYPGVQLPYLQKNSWFQTNLQNIKKQKAMLQFFLHDLIQNKEIRNSRIFEDFLTLKQHKQIKRKFQQYGKMDQLKSIEQLCVLGGNVDVVINENQRIYHQQLTRYLDTMEDYLGKKNKLMDTLGEQFAAVNNTLINLSKLSQSMSEQVKKFNQKVNDDEIPCLQNTFNLVSKSLQQWASRINFQSKVVTKRLAPFYKYQKDNISTMRELLTTQSTLYKSYIRRLAQSSSTTSEPFTSQKLKPFKTSILQQSKNFTILKYQLGYISNMTCKQSVRFFQLMADSFKEKYVYMAEKYKERLGKDVGFFNNVVSGAWVGN